MMMGMRALPPTNFANGSSGIAHNWTVFNYRKCLGAPHLSVASDVGVIWANQSYRLLAKRSTRLILTKSLITLLTQGIQ